MPTNERENARKEKARAKDKKTKRIIWTILGVIIAILFIMRVCEIDFQAVKDRFIDENGNFVLFMTTDKDAYPYQLDSSNGVKIQGVNDKISVLTKNSLSILNPRNAEKTYSFDHGYATPMIKYAGNYICMFDQGGTRLRLDTYKKNMYEQVMPKSILCAAVADNGNVIYATMSDDSKSKLVVMKNSLDKILEIDVNDGYVVSVAIDSSGKKCAYATINSDKAVLKTTVHTINVGDKSDIATFKLKDSNVLDMHYRSKSFYVVCDNALYTITSQNKQNTVYKSGSISVKNFTYTPKNELVLAYNAYSGASNSNISCITIDGKEKTNIKVSKKIKSLSATSKEIVVLFSDKIVSYALSNGEERSSKACDDTLKCVSVIASRVFVQQGQMLDIVE